MKRKKKKKKKGLRQEVTKDTLHYISIIEGRVTGVFRGSVCLDDRGKAGFHRHLFNLKKEI